MSDGFLQHCILVTETALQLNQLYGSDAHRDVVTKSYMAQFAAYPAWTPDLHIQAQQNVGATTRDYFIDIWDGTAPFFVSVRKTNNYVNFCQSGEWYEDALFPITLAVCRDERSQHKLYRQMRRIRQARGDEELRFAATTLQQLMEATSADDKVWLRAGSVFEETTCSLEDLAPTAS